MKFSEIVKQASALLQDKGQVSYRMLKREFGLDDEELADLKAELIEVDGLAADKDGKMLVWAGTPSGQHAGSAEQPQVEEVTLSRPVPTAPSTEAERRQLTVMFCDLVDSTALSAQLDPEEYRAVVQAYQETCTAVIRRYDGHVAQHLGDGLLVYFGYPLAHEDDARRAVRAGLEIVQALQSRARQQAVDAPLPHGRGSDPIRVRIGIHTGVVVIGEIGSEKREILALGETPNIAARIQGLAEPNTVLISTATYRLLEGVLDCRALGPQSLKGVATPVQLYQVVGEGEGRSRLEVALRRGLTPLVGRDEEVELLRRRWEQTKTGDGQVVLLSGEAGIGKSRLLHALREQLSSEPHTQLECRCSPFHQNSAFYPVIDLLQRVLEFRREDTGEEKVGKLERFLGGQTRGVSPDLYP